MAPMPISFPVPLRRQPILSCQPLRFTKSSRWFSANEASQTHCKALMQQGLVVDLTPDISVLAARTNVEHHLPMADSIILATSRLFGATIWTQDADFKEIDGVRYVAKKNG